MISAILIMMQMTMGKEKLRFSTNTSPGISPNKGIRCQKTICARTDKGGVDIVSAGQINRGGECSPPLGLRREPDMAGYHSGHVELSHHNLAEGTARIPSSSPLG